MTYFLFKIISIYIRLWMGRLSGKPAISVVRRMASENNMLRKQLLVLKRNQKKRLTMTPLDRLHFAAILGMDIPKRLARRCSILFSPDTLLKFHRYLVKRKYSRLFRNKPKKRGPKGKPPELVRLVIEMKRKNPGYGAEKIAGYLTARGHKINDPEGYGACEPR